MRVFVYEYTCATPAGPNLPASLRAEGLAMLTAIATDFTRMGGVETRTLLADEFADLPGVDCRRSGHDEQAAFTRLVKEAEHTLVIAPEFDGLLETRCRWVADAGGLTLNASLEAIRLTGDKLALADHLRERGVATPATYRLAPVRFPAVVKPRHGAGSQSTFLVRSEAEILQARASAEAEGNADELIAQPFQVGQPASVAFLIGPGVRLPLWPAAQRLSSDGRFRYLGGTVPLEERYRPRATRLAEAAVASVPGLRGYVGVDLVLGEADDGRDDWIIEINPRLTTSYIGLRHLTDANLAEYLLRIATGQGFDLAALASAWACRLVHFQADGHWEFVAATLPPGRP